MSLSEELSSNAVLLFRSGDDIARTAEEFERRGIRTIPFEAIERKCVDAAERLKEIAVKANYLVFISRNSVLCSMQHIDGSDTRAHIIATGMSTAKLLEGMGADVEFAPASGGLRAVIEWLEKKAPGLVAIVCESHSDFDFSKLEMHGFSFEKIVAYEVHTKKMAMDTPSVSLATHVALFSPLEVTSLRLSADAGTLAAIRKLKAVCVGRKTYEAACTMFDRVTLAKSNSIDAVADEIMGDLD